MPTLYLTEQGSVVRQSGQRVVVEKDGEKLLDVPLFKVETILIYGMVQVTTQAISMLLEAGVELAFLTMDGKLKGQLTPPKAKNVVLRMGQYRRATDPEFALGMAKQIVRGKVENGLAALRRFRYNHPEIDLAGCEARMQDALATLDRKTAAPTVLGVEGIAAVAYFDGLAKMCLGELKFEGRNRRPPRDPINALLSLGYVLVGNELASLLDGMGFDPYIGFLHGIDYGRQSLALDMTEEFRCPVVDRFTLYLANRNMLRADDFEQRDGGVYLKREGLKRYFAEYEKWMTGKDRSGRSFRDVFKAQANAMARAITEGVPYQPYRLDG